MWFYSYRLMIKKKKKKTRVSNCAKYYITDKIYMQEPWGFNQVFRNIR